MKKSSEKILSQKFFKIWYIDKNSYKLINASWIELLSIKWTIYAVSYILLIQFAEFVLLILLCTFDDQNIIL